MQKAETTAIRIRRVLFLGQGLFSAGYLAAVTLASIVGAALADNPAWAGVPAAALLLGRAVSASFWGAAMDWFGRRRTLIVGQLIGAVGGGLAFWATMIDSLPLYLIAMLALGSAKANLDLGRYVAAEVHPPDHRARAIATVVFGATIGAVLGPLLVGPTGGLALSLGLKETAGPYLAASLALLVNGLLLYVGLRPEPGTLAKEMAGRFPQPGPAGSSGRVFEALRNPAAASAALILIVAQMVMVMVMVITSLYMQDIGHELTAISLVISSHTFGMYAFSAVSGQLVDRIGRQPVIIAGLLLLAVSSSLAGLSSGVLPLGVTLFGLGLGWNLCYVGGSTLLSDNLGSRERARVQGVTDTFVAMASAIGSLGSGVVFAAVGYGTMGVIGAALSLLPVVLLLQQKLAGRRSLPDTSGQ